ncbi:hypothetical protein ASZ90_010590 [hydrocarbon metagenome]|uniref:Uncharacterized protein n=1 Tax=hydrocarbon metagenome TaxID=938273 RepID=A0A0W8FFY5_9ZZZZ
MQPLLCNLLVTISPFRVAAPPSRSDQKNGSPKRDALQPMHAALLSPAEPAVLPVR